MFHLKDNARPKGYTLFLVRNTVYKHVCFFIRKLHEAALKVRCSFNLYNNRQFRNMPDIFSKFYQTRTKALVPNRTTAATASALYCTIF